MKRILVCGSIANDVIMSYPAKFSDLVVPEHLESFNWAITAPVLEKQEGGTAQNIAYSLGLLGLKDQTLMVGAVGKDFEASARLSAAIDYTHILRDAALFTAVCYVINAVGGQQIIVFHPGAMGQASRIDLGNHLSAVAYAIIAPNDKQAMIRHMSDCVAQHIPTFFDPGQALELFSPEELRLMIDQATYLICNEYEFGLIQKRSGYDEAHLVTCFEKIIVTLGAQGVRLLDANGSHTVPGHAVENVVDATGCGDAFRGGLLSGLLQDKTWEDSAKIGNLVASFAVQKHGGMNHSFTLEDIIGDVASAK